MAHSITKSVENLRSVAGTPPKWLKISVALSIGAATYFLGMAHGITFGAAAQSTGSYFVHDIMIELPFAIYGVDKFIATTEVRAVLGTATMFAHAFAVAGLAGVGGWVVAQH